MKVHSLTTSAVIGFWLCLIQPTTAAEMTVRVADVSGVTGSAVNVPISTEGGPKLAAARVVLIYDANVLEVVGVESGQALVDGEAQSGFTVNAPGRVTMNFVSMDGVVANGNLFLVNFNVKGSAGTTSDLSLDRVLAWRADNQVDVLAETYGSTFTVTSQLPLPLTQLIAIAAGAVVLLLIVVALRRRSGSAKAAGDATVNCPQCAAANLVSAGFCIRCGTGLRKATCSSCGHENLTGARFCSECGKSMAEKNP